MRNEDIGGFSLMVAVFGGIWSVSVIFLSMPEGVTDLTLKIFLTKWLSEGLPLIGLWLLWVILMKYSAQTFWQMRGDREWVLPRKYVPHFLGFFVLGVPVIQYLLQGINSLF